MKDKLDYDDKGNVLGHTIFKNSEWTGVPECILESLYKKVCVTPEKPSKKR